MLTLLDMKRIVLRVSRAAHGLRRLGPGNSRRNFSFLSTLADALDVAKREGHNRRASSVKYVRATRSLAEISARANSNYGLGYALGRYSWIDLGKNRALDGALSVARAALNVGRPELAEDFAKQIIELRPQSKAAWKILSRAYDALDRRDLARVAAARFAQLTGVDEPESTTAALAVDGLLLQALQEAEGNKSRDPVSALYRKLQNLVTGVESARVDADLIADVTSVQPLTGRASIAAAADLVLRQALAFGADASVRTRELARAAVAARPLEVLPQVTREAANVVRPMDAAGLRRYLSGKSVCLVANSQRVAESRSGELIDSYDVVARFNSFKIDAPNTGSKTSLHATIHMHNFNWSVPVDVRLVFSGNLNAWRASVNKYLDSDAQGFIGDATLRWPVRGKDLVGDSSLVDVPTSGFNLLRLVDLLDVSTAIDLIGFDFNTSGAFRLDSAMHLPVATAHDYNAERDWVMANATKTSDLVLSLR